MANLQKRYVAALAILVVLAACEKKVDENNAALPADTAQAVNPAPAPSPEPIVTDLDELNKSGIKGEATATHSPNDVTVSVLLKEGAKPEVTYPAHIHTGTCEKGGPVAVELAPVKNLQSSKTIPLSALPTDKPAYIQVHDAAGKPVACGNMKGHTEGDMRADTTRATTTRY